MARSRDRGVFGHRPLSRRGACRHDGARIRCAARATISTCRCWPPALSKPTRAPASCTSPRAMAPTISSWARRTACRCPTLCLADGVYLPHVPLFAGRSIYRPDGKPGDANEAVIAAIEAAGGLLARGTLVHSYPHSWRSKAPLIFRNTPQWFISFEANGLRRKALAAIDETRWVPPQGSNRIEAMVESRPDWCVSRQRAWGVPIAVFTHRETGEPLRDPLVVERVAAAVEREGADAWFTRRSVGVPRQRLRRRRVGEGHRHRRGVVRFGLDPCLCAGTAAGAAMAGLALSRRLGPASRLVSFLADRSLRHARPRALRGGADARLRARRRRAQDVEIARQRHRAAGRHAAERRRHPAPLGGRLGLRRGCAHRPGDPEAPRATPIAGCATRCATCWARSPATPRPRRSAPRRCRSSSAGSCTAWPSSTSWSGVRSRLSISTACSPRCIISARWICRPSISTSARTGSIAMRRTMSGGARRGPCSTAAFDCLVRWLAPILCFTAEEAWLARHGDAPGRSIHLELFRRCPGGLARRRARRALGEAARSAPRRDRRAGTRARRQADRVEPAGRGRALRPGAVGRPAPRCRSRRAVHHLGGNGASRSRRPRTPSRCPMSPEIGVRVSPAPGERCERCWRVLPEVGRVPGHDDLCRRCAEVVDAPASRVGGECRVMLERGLATAVVVAILDQLSKAAVLAHFAGRALGDRETVTLVLQSRADLQSRDQLWPVQRRRRAQCARLLACRRRRSSSVLIFWLSRAASPFLAVAIGLIIGGAVGNVIDRLRSRRGRRFSRFSCRIFIGRPSTLPTARFVLASPRCCLTACFCAAKHIKK